MDTALAEALRTLLHRQQVAALGTLHRGDPAVSMVPYALLPGGAGVVIHVSRLATHTQDMLAHPAVSLLMMAAPDDSATPLALPRAALRGQARPCMPDDALYDTARALYLARFPDSEELFGFSDFSLFVVEVRSVRFVAGFAQAVSLTGEMFAEVMCSAE